MYDFRSLQIILHLPNDVWVHASGFKVITLDKYPVMIRYGVEER